MSFTEKLAKLSLDIRHRATGREFEEEEYQVRWNGKDAELPPGSYTDTQLPLTLERYQNGPGNGSNNPSATGGYGGDPNWEYYVYPGSEVWNHKFDGFAWVKETLMEFGQSNLSSMEALIDTMKSVPTELCAKIEWQPKMDYDGDDKDDASLNRPDLSTADPDILLENGIAELDHWSGETATKYKHTFGSNGDAWSHIVQGNYVLGEMLVAALEAQLAIFITTRESIKGIADKTSSTLWSVHEGDGAGSSAALTIFGAIVGTALSLASFGTAATLFGAAISITNALVGQAENGDAINSGAKGNEADIGGDTVSAVLQSMNSAIASLESEINQKQDDLRVALRNTYNEVLATRSNFELTIAKDVPPMSREAMGTREVSAHPDDLKEAAETAFPNAAKPLLSAHGILADSGSGSEEFKADNYDGQTSVHTAWIDLRDLLQDLTGANGQKVKRTGEVLLEYAVGIDAVDEDSAGKVEKTYQELDVEFSGNDHEVYVDAAATRKGI